MEEDRNIGWATFDNPARQFGDTARLSLHQEFHHLAAPGDLLEFDGSATFTFDGDQESFYGSASYRTFLGAYGSYLEGYVGNVVARRDATGTLEQTDIDGRTVILAIGYPFIRDFDTFGHGLLELQRIDTDVDVAGTVFESEIDVASATWIYGKALAGGDSVEAAFNYSVGERSSPAATFDNGDADSGFVRAGLGYEAGFPAIGEYGRMFVEVRGQYSTDRLSAVEEFYVGAINEDRGYETAEGQGDSGVSASLEISRDFFPDSPYASRLRPFAFVDAGYVENNAPSAGEIDNATFGSVGLGRDAELAGDILMRGYAVVPYRDGPSTDAGDPAIYLSQTRTW